MGSYRLTILFAICAMLFIATATLIVNRVFIHPEIDSLRASVELTQGREDLQGDFKPLKATSCGPPWLPWVGFYWRS
jgi:hypothetical protein